MLRTECRLCRFAVSSSLHCQVSSYTTHISHYTQAFHYAAPQVAHMAGYATSMFLPSTSNTERCATFFVSWAWCAIPNTLRQTGSGDCYNWGGENGERLSAKSSDAAEGVSAEVLVSSLPHYKFALKAAHLAQDTMRSSDIFP